MKKILPILAVVAGLFLAVPSHAQTIISLQFPNGGTTLYNNYSNSFAGQNLTAGEAAAAYWNADSTNGNHVGYPTNISGPNAGNFPFSTSLLDSTGAATGITYTGTTDGNFNSSGNGFSGAGDNLLFASGSLVNYNSGGLPNTFTFNGLNSAHTYSVIVYANELFGDINGVGITLGSTTYYLNTDHALTSYVQSTATTLGAAGAANYVEFTGLTGLSTFTVSANSSVADTAFTVPGIQIIDNGALTAAPEPSTVVLVAVGLAGLAFHLRRKRLV
jgi:hypothetical protein